MISAFFEYDFIQNAVISGIVIGFIAPILGVFLVVRRLSMIADALSHITLSGIAFSLLLTKTFAKSIPLFANLNPIYIGMFFSVMGSLGIEKLRKSYKHYEEIAIPIIMAAGIGFGVVFISMANGFNVDLFNYLFGSIIAIQRSDMWTIVFVGLVVIAFLFLFYKELFSLSFDEESAKINGIPYKIIHLLFTLVVAIVIASAMRIVGILLVSALMVLPVAASIQLAKSFKQTIYYSILFGQLAVILGLHFSFELNWAPGGTIVIISFLLLSCVLLWKKWFVTSA